MARTVSYSVAPRYNPFDKEEPPRYYARAQANGDISIREICERIQQNCTVTKADVHAVLVALEDVVIDSLKGGEIVRLGDLGTMQISLVCKTTATEKECDSSCIKKARIRFRPGIALSGMLTSLAYKKVAKKSQQNEETTSDDSSEVPAEEEPTV